MNAPRIIRGLAGLAFTREELRHPITAKLRAALQDELALLREQNDGTQDIARTTLLRGQIQCVKNISARTLEVGPESRTSEPEGPELSFGLPPVAGSSPG